MLSWPFLQPETPTARDSVTASKPAAHGDNLAQIEGWEDTTIILLGWKAQKHTLSDTRAGKINLGNVS